MLTLKPLSDWTRAQDNGHHTRGKMQWRLPSGGLALERIPTRRIRHCFDMTAIRRMRIVHAVEGRPQVGMGKGILKGDHGGISHLWVT